MQPLDPETVSDALSAIRDIELLPGFRRLRLLREDLFQEAAIGALRAARSYRPGRGASFATWVKRRAVGAMLDFMRRQYPLGGLQRRHSGDVPVMLTGERIPPIASGILPPDRAALHSELRRLVANLPERQRSLIRQRYWGERTQAEIAAECGCHATRVCQIERAAIELLRRQAA